MSNEDGSDQSASPVVERRFSDNYENNYGESGSDWKVETGSKGEREGEEVEDVNDASVHQLSSASMTSDSEERAEDDSGRAHRPSVNISISKAALYRQNILYEHNQAGSPPRPIPSPKKTNVQHHNHHHLQQHSPERLHFKMSPRKTLRSRWWDILERGSVNTNDPDEMQALRTLRERVESIRLLQQGAQPLHASN